MNNHIVMRLSGSRSELTQLPLPQFTPLDFPGWHGLTIEGSALEFFIFDIKDGASEFPLHASEDEWLAYVISGSGQLFAGTTDNEQKTSSVAFFEGDAMTFEANTPHAWKMNPGAGKILFCKQGQ